MIRAEELIRKFKQALAEKWGYIWGTSGDEWTEADQQQLVRYFEKNYGEAWKDSAAAKENDRYKSAVSGSKWIGHRVADCSGLFAWAFRQLGGSIAHGSNSIYRSYCSSKGTMKAGKKSGGAGILPGTAVFTGKSADSHPHIGLYIGDGTVIEAQGTNAGVIESKVTNSKWTYWGELKGIDYSGETPDTPAEEEGQLCPTIRRGSTGEFVIVCQEILVDLGYDLGPSNVDGKFGPKTEAAVKTFQQRHGLQPDGVVGPKTWAQLLLYEGDEPAEGICREWSGASMKKE